MSNVKASFAGNKIIFTSQKKDFLTRDTESEADGLPFKTCTEG